LFLRVAKGDGKKRGVRKEKRIEASQSAKRASEGARPYDDAKRASEGAAPKTQSAKRANKVRPYDDQCGQRRYPEDAIRNRASGIALNVKTPRFRIF
jgi:hypothetical protein